MDPSTDPAATERPALDLPPAGPSSWQRFCPCDAWRHPILEAFATYLDEPASRALLARLDSEARYPAPVLERLRALGLARLFTGRGDGDGETGVTAWHLSALNALLARRNGSVAISVGVNALALLPAYIAADPDQRSAIYARFRDGAACSMLLTELAHGSNLLRNQARAEPGTLTDQGTFTPVASAAEATHFRLQGEKHMINGGNEHELLFALMRTGGYDADPRGPVNAIAARADHTFFWIDRGPGVEGLPRWRTLPAPAADISGVRFRDVIVPKHRVIGRVGGGFRVVQSTLSVSRGAISSLACGAVAAGRDLAFRYARHRNIYGTTIAHLPAIASHLQHLDALDRAAAAISLKATAMLNAAGLGAAYYTAVAKLMACELAEEGVAEGKRVLSGRALVEDLPYARVMRDVLLYGVFDGTSHVMLEEICRRLEQMAREDASVSAAPAPAASIDRLRQVYATAPKAADELLRERRRAELLPLAAHLRALAALPAETPAAPVARTAEALLSLVRTLSADGRWKHDQALRFSAGHVLGLLETLSALLELFDPDRRHALGVTPTAPTNDHADASRDVARDRLGVSFAVSWLGGRAVRRLRETALSAGIDDTWVPLPVREAGGLEALEAELLAPMPALRAEFRERIVS
jgi:alkylation response protein AidB-like acyl-CoA dehydrogenase